VLTNDGSAASAASVIAIDTGLEPGDLSDLQRYLDATRSTLLYARRVILVEGPAELFLIPPLVKAVKKIDLDRHGISVVPIHGTHFDVYAKLFSSDGMPKKCAIITDGDLCPSDSDLDVQAEDAPPELPDLTALEGDYVKVFQCETTFERELTRPGA
jgi:putative ATP-dependent endonuclease of OLD family